HYRPSSSAAKSFIGTLLVKDPKMRLSPKDCRNHPWLKTAKIEWTPKTHRKFSEESRKQVMIVLMMAAFKPDGTPRHPETLFHRLPKELVFLILKFTISILWPTG